MGIQGEPETVVRVPNIGTARVQLETSVTMPQSSWFLRAHAEGYYTVDGVLEGKPSFEHDVKGERLPEVFRTFGQIAPDTVTIEGAVLVDGQAHTGLITISGLLTANAIKAFIDKYRAADKAAAEQLQGE